MTTAESALFASKTGCKKYLTVRDKKEFDDIKVECLQLWNSYQDTVGEEKGFISGFAADFDGRFWELYFAHVLGSRIQRRRSSNPAGLDFKTVDDVLIEVTVASRGDTPNGLIQNKPSASDHHEPNIPQFDRVILRITNALSNKSQSNKISKLGPTEPVVIAINLPYTEAGNCDLGNGLGARALLGVNPDLFEAHRNGSFTQLFTRVGHVQKSEACPVSCEPFLGKSYAHISAVILAHVDPFSSSYADPSFEFIHNPNAKNPLPDGWLGFGSEYRAR